MPDFTPAMREALLWLCQWANIAEGGKVSLLSAVLAEGDARETRVGVDQIRAAVTDTYSALCTTKWNPDLYKEAMREHEAACRVLRSYLTGTGAEPVPTPPPAEKAEGRVEECMGAVRCVYKERTRDALALARELEPMMDDHTHKHYLIWKITQVLSGGRDA